MAKSISFKLDEKTTIWVRAGTNIKELTKRFENRDKEQVRKKKEFNKGWEK